MVWKRQRGRQRQRLLHRQKDSKRRESKKKAVMSFVKKRNRDRVRRDRLRRRETKHHGNNAED